MGYGIWGLRCGILGLGFGVWGLGFWVWDLESGVGDWGVKFGIWGLGLGTLCREKRGVKLNPESLAPYPEPSTLNLES